MGTSRHLLIPLVISLACMLGLANLVANRYTVATPPLSISLSSPVSKLSDFTGIAAGFRRLTADIAWIQTLIYYGTIEEGTPKEELEQGGGKYPNFLAYCQRVAQIDPNFKYIYYYGGAVLGWNLNRQNEAETLLREGIKAHPREWRYQQFLASLAFQKTHNINDLVNFLEGFIHQADCPNILRSILANIYKKEKRYRDSVRVWMIIYDTGDPSYTQRSLSQIQELAPLAHIPLNK